MYYMILNINYLWLNKLSLITISSLIGKEPIISNILRIKLWSC